MNGPSKARSLGISLICAVVIGLQMTGRAHVDTTTLALIGIGVLPWLMEYVSAFKAGPGGIEITRIAERVEQNNALLQTTQASVTEARAEATRAADIAQVTQVVATTGVGKAQPAGGVPAAAAGRRTRGFEDLAPDAGRIDAALADPLAAVFGNGSESRGRILAASVKPLPWNPDLFELTLTVSSLPGQRPLKDGERVIFHLHPTFTPSVVEVTAVEGRARLVRYAWGAFTAGAEIPSDGTRLGLDLAELAGAPQVFRDR